jgi:hypothetical protein
MGWAASRNVSPSRGGLNTRIFLSLPAGPALVEVIQKGKQRVARIGGAGAWESV